MTNRVLLPAALAVTLTLAVAPVSAGGFAGPGFTDQFAEPDRSMFDSITGHAGDPDRSRDCSYGNTIRTSWGDFCSWKDALAIFKDKPETPGEGSQTPTTPGGGGGTVQPETPAPVPLPAAGWLSLAGIGGLAAIRRRRRT